MFRLLSFAALCAALSMEGASAFVPSHHGRVVKSTLSMGQSEDHEKKFAASVLTAAYLFANVISVAPAFALADDFAGSTQVVAAKSGGRMGGRSSMGNRGASSSYKASPSRSTTRIERTTVIQQPAVIQSPVVVAPPVYGGYGYGVDPAAVGLSVGLSAINGIGREMREQSQEREIMRERQELSEAKMKAAELEGRLRALEAR